MHVLFLLSFFRYKSRKKPTFEHNSVQKDKMYFYVHVDIKIIDFRYVRLTKKVIFGGNHGYGYLYLEFITCRSKNFRLHTKLHDTVGAMLSRSVEGPGYCFMIGPGPISCMLSHVLGLLFCLYVKLTLLYFFNSADFRSGFFWILLDIEFSYRNVGQELGVFIDKNVKDIHSQVQSHTTSILVCMKFARNYVEQSLSGLHRPYQSFFEDVKGR